MLYIENRFLRILIRLFLVLPLCLGALCEAEDSFGYISYSGGNIGDDIQALAALQFLPYHQRVPIDREWIADFSHEGVLPTLVNGWFLHTKDFWWGSVAPPEKSWPPAPAIDPLFISMHIIQEVHPILFSPEGIAYLKEHGPIGARDLSTLAELQNRGIPSYFSGCLTLTLKNPEKKRDHVIYAVDVDNETLHYIKRHAKVPVVALRHGVPASHMQNHKRRLLYAEHLLNKYRRAKCVVTTRLHCAMPCLAFETPVLFLGGSCSRFDGLKELTHHCKREDLLSGEFAYDFDTPPPNPEAYRPIRDHLIEIVTEWVAKKTGR